MEKFIFACVVTRGASEREALILARSIRSFAGRFSASPIWVLFPQERYHLSEAVSEELFALNVHLIPFEIDEEVFKFPFAAKTVASATAESQAVGKTDCLVWMDADSIVISEPAPLLLADGKKLGCRPVDLALIGSRYDEPVAPFWQAIYEHCNVPEDRLFPVTTSVDQEILRPYFNAGLLVVRPEAGVLQLWRDYFSRLYRGPYFEAFYQQDQRYAIFVHQATLAGGVLASMTQQEIQEFSHLVNYPLHLHVQYPSDRRPASLNELITCRYDEELAWRQFVPVKEPLRSWLDDQLSMLE